MKTLVLVGTIVFFTNAKTLILESAGYNENTFSGGTLISRLKGNVSFRFGDVHIRGDEAVWYRSEGRVEFTNNIAVTMKKQSMTCRRIGFDKRKKIVTASGNINFYDSLEMVRFIAKEAIYDLNKKILSLRKNPDMFKYDTVSSDTLHISGRNMIYKDKIKTAFINRNTTIGKGKMVATSQSATYEIKTGVAKLRTKPVVNYDSQILTGDSINVLVKADKIKAVYVSGNAYVIYREKLKDDSSRTEIKSDSMAVSIGNERIDSVKCFENSDVIYTLKSHPDEINRAEGRNMDIFFKDDNKGEIKIYRNAIAEYYIDDDNGRGVNSVSSDVISLYLKDGSVYFVTVEGGARGRYISRKSR